MADQFVRFEVPAFDHFVLAAGKEVGVSWGDGEAADGGYMARQREAERTCGKIPDLYCSVTGTRSKPFVPGLDSTRPNPTKRA